MVSGAPSVGAQRQVEALARSQPESGPWLALVTEALGEAARPEWGAVADRVRLADGVATSPLLAGATVPVERALVEGWMRRLLIMAGEAGPSGSALGGAADAASRDGPDLLEAAINDESERLRGQATTLGVDADALGALARLAAFPPLHALQRRFGSAVAADWHAGFCPVCGAWPTLAESRGLDRARHLRCARCGVGWAMPALRCPFCENTDHRQLGSLVPEAGGEARRIETCDRCRGYVKSVATLRAWAPDEIALADLATVDLDLAAVERDFGRPETPAVALGLRLVPVDDDAPVGR